jgi:hypothetical protein
MGSRPKLNRLIATLTELAKQELGELAEPVDFVVQRISTGQTVTNLAQEVAEVMGEPASRSWLSWRFNHLSPQAKERIAHARRNAAEVSAIRGQGVEAAEGKGVSLSVRQVPLAAPAVQVGEGNGNVGRLRGSHPAMQ